MLCSRQLCCNRYRSTCCRRVTIGRGLAVRDHGMGAIALYARTVLRLPLATFPNQATKAPAIENSGPSHAPQAPALVGEGHTREPRPRTRARRLHLDGPRKNCAILEKIGRGEHTAETLGEAIRDVDAELLYQSCRQDPACGPETHSRVRQGGIAQAVRRAVSRGKSPQRRRGPATSRCPRAQPLQITADHSST